MGASKELTKYTSSITRICRRSKKRPVAALWWIISRRSKTHTKHASHCERLGNQRPKLVVPPDVSTTVKDIWMGNVLLLETFLVNFLSAPEPFRRKNALGWVWGFFIYIFAGSFNDPEQRGELFVSESRCTRCNREQEFYYELLLLLLYFRQRLLNSC